MKLEEYYTIGELLLNETSSTKQEFDAKIGRGVESSNKREQEKAVRDITKDAERFDGEGRKKDNPVKPRVEFPDYNKTTLDVNFEYDPDESWKKRVQAQAEGYPSVQNKEKNGYDQSLGFDGNKNFYDARKKMSKDRNSLDTIERESGLKARIKKDEIDYSDKTAFVNEGHSVKVIGNGIDPTPKTFNSEEEAMKYANSVKRGNPTYHVLVNGKEVNEAKQIKRLKFKNTIFLSESHLLSKVPEDYRVDENRFYMQDKTGTDYLVECKADPFGYVHMEIANKFNKQNINEELEKMKRLADYKYSDDNKKVDTKKLESMSESISNFKEKLNN